MLSNDVYTHSSGPRYMVNVGRFPIRNLLQTLYVRRGFHSGYVSPSASLGPCLPLVSATLGNRTGWAGAGRSVE